MAKSKSTSFDKTYFVSKLHEGARGMLQLLTQRLDDTGWKVTCSTLSQVQIYAKGNRSRVLVTTALSTLGDVIKHAYYDGDVELSVAEYLEMHTQVTKLRMTLNQIVTVKETVYRKPGTADMLAIYSSETGIYVRAIGSQPVHGMLSEYYTLASDPAILYTATFDGVLYEGYEDENGDIIYDEEEEY